MKTGVSIIRWVLFDHRQLSVQRQTKSG